MRPCFITWILGMLLPLASLTGCDGVSTQQPAAPEDPVPFSKNASPEISKGTPVYVRLRESVSSATAQTGQSFSAVLDEPLVINGKTVVTEGADIAGQVIAARKSGRLHNAGYVRLTLSTITVNGKEIPIQTTSVFVEGASYKNHNLAYVGGGAGSGALIEALAGGKGSLVGAPVGSAGGATAAYTKGKKEVGFIAKGRLSFLLLQPLNLSQEPPAPPERASSD